MTLSAKLAAVLANVLLVAALAGAPAGATARSAAPAIDPTGFEPVAGAVFNDPTGTPEEQFRIIDHVTQLIDNSPAGSSIRLATMTVGSRTADALIRAHQRGVNVRVILPAQMLGKPSPSRVTAETGTNIRSSSYVFYCRNACYRDSSQGVHHNKLFLFSQVGTTPNVISTSSGNLDNYMAERRYNDAYTVVDDAAGYRAGVAYFDLMLTDSYHNAAAPTTTGKGVTYHFFPRRRANLFGAIMNNVRCHGATGGTGINGRTAIRMTHVALGPEPARRGTSGRGSEEARLQHLRARAELQHRPRNPQDVPRGQGAVPVRGHAANGARQPQQVRHHLRQLPRPDQRHQRLRGLAEPHGSRQLIL